jgi:hypothetical protein
LEPLSDGWKGIKMLLQYIQAALEQAHYELIEDDEPFYGEVPGLPGCGPLASL